MVAFWGAVLFTMFGLCTEIVFTGISSWSEESFLGHVSLLMIPVYAAVYVAVGPLLYGLERLGWTRAAIRIPLTVVAIYAFEWGFGSLYAAVGLAPWHYEHGWASDFSNGHITLYYLPAWIVFAAIVVPVWRRIHALAPEIARVAGARG